MNSRDDAGAMKTESNHTDIKSFDKGPHFRADSALLEFLGLQRRAPECALAEYKGKPFVVRVRRTRRRARSRSGASVHISPSP